MAEKAQKGMKKTNETIDVTRLNCFKPRRSVGPASLSSAWAWLLVTCSVGWPFIDVITSPSRMPCSAALLPGFTCHHSKRRKKKETSISKNHLGKHSKYHIKERRLDVSSIQPISDDGRLAEVTPTKILFVLQIPFPFTNDSSPFFLNNNPGGKFEKIKKNSFFFFTKLPLFSTREFKTQGHNPWRATGKPEKEMAATEFGELKTKKKKPARARACGSDGWTVEVSNAHGPPFRWTRGRGTEHPPLYILYIHLFFLLLFHFYFP